MKSVRSISVVAGFFCLLSSIILAQSPSEDWYFGPSTSEVNGIGVDNVYESLPENSVPHPVVVAIIDSGVDLDHEDLEENLWVNDDEIAGNGKDDDGNGYVDDVHGWNFIGGPDGAMVIDETYEVTRLYSKYRDYFEDKDTEDLSKKDQKLYAKYEEYKRIVEKERGKAKRILSEIEQNEQMILGALEAFEQQYPDHQITREFVDDFDPGNDQNLMIAADIFKQAYQYGFEFSDIDSLKSEIVNGYAEAKENSESKVEYGYNPDFDSREIIQDDYSDVNQRVYGNSNVGGDFAFHGTHVAGIVGAIRDNDLGVNGIAPNVRLMILRVVPNGDEHDKDVANAIRYAAENGASVINMSFGKGYSPQKQAVDKAVKFARKKDVLLVHAAGNSGSNNDEETHYPVPQYEKTWFLGKKEADNWIEVGALGSIPGEEAIASFSNYGKETVDLFAPGVGIYSTAPGNTYEYANGTSMASPVVAGVAALIRSYYPTLTARQVKDVLVESVRKPDFKVQHPETGDLVEMAELCKSAGYIDAANAFELASKTKGKKKKPKSVGEVSKA